MVGAEGVKSTSYTGNEMSVTLLADTWAAHPRAPRPLCLHWHGQRPTLSATILPHTANLGIDDDSAVPVRTSQGTLWSQATQISVLKKNNGLLFVDASCPAGGFQGFCSIPTRGQVEQSPSGTLTAGKRGWELYGVLPQQWDAWPGNNKCHFHSCLPGQSHSCDPIQGQGGPEMWCHQGPRKESQK